MRIHLKCSCGAEATWDNDNDSEVATALMTDLADRWHMDHAKCREAWSEDAEDSSLLSKALREHADIRTSTEPRNECSHSWIHKSNTAGKYVECQKCYKRDVL